jgi:hypothetical protein
MISHIFSHTPVYVWGILAFLIFRGVLALRERDITMTRMTIIPVVMLVLALQSIASRFGLGSLAMAAWLVATAAMALQRGTFGASRVKAGLQPGSLRMGGSWTPLLLMLTIFVIKYAMAIVQAVQPQLAQGAVFAMTACGLLGLCNGWFLGQLARDIATARRLGGQGRVAGASISLG